jgi:SpoVK/Ycf46/Vps4 family AAA+-type ATPase
MKKQNELSAFPYNDKKVDSFFSELDDINLESSNYLLLLVGPYEAGKKSILSRLQKKRGNFIEIDIRDMISLNEQTSFRKIDETFSAIGETEKNILFRNGDALAGEYTGFTYSSVRYATPQERYLLKKMTGTEKFFVIDIKEFENIDKTLQRYAQSAILFDQPDSFVSKLFWKLRQIKVHGHTFANKRPAGA